MREAFFVLITGSAIAAAVVFIWVLLSLRSAIKDLKRFLGTAESSFLRTSQELERDLACLKGLIEDVSRITDDVRTLSGVFRETGENVQHISRDMKQTVGNLRAFSSMAAEGLSGWRDGVKTGLAAFWRSLFQGEK